tara:strand:+ start:193 stop:450 length:258 start_codon:yes stop_codon:yes gene_type:complete
LLGAVDDCTTNIFERKGSAGKFLGDFNIYELHVGMAWRHLVALGVVEPLQGDVCGDCDLCIGKYKGVGVGKNESEKLHPMMFSKV